MTNSDQSLLILTVVVLPVLAALTYGTLARGTLGWLCRWMRWRLARPSLHADNPVWREELFQWKLRRPRRLTKGRK